MIRKLIVIVSLCFSLSALATNQIVGLAATIGVGAGINAGLNAAFGKQMKAVCDTGFGAFACPIAIMAFSQVVVDAVLGQEANNTENQARASAGDFSTASGYNDSAGPSNAELQKFATDSKKALKDLEKLGYKKNKDGSITGPNGKTAPAGALDSGQEMADAGLIDPVDIEKYDDALAKHKKKKDRIIVKSLGGGAKGGYRGPKKRRTASTDYDYSYGNGIDKSKIKAAKTSGLSKDFGGTPIGIASDDIFNMVSERYNQMDRRSQFIENPSGSYPGQR